MTLQEYSKKYNDCYVTETLCVRMYVSEYPILDSHFDDELLWWVDKDGHLMLDEYAMTYEQEEDTRQLFKTLDSEKVQNENN